MRFENNWRKGFSMISRFVLEKVKKNCVFKIYFSGIFWNFWKSLSRRYRLKTLKIFHSRVQEKLLFHCELYWRVGTGWEPGNSGLKPVFAPSCAKICSKRPFAHFNKSCRRILDFCKYISSIYFLVFSCRFPLCF